MLFYPFVTPKGVNWRNFIQTRNPLISILNSVIRKRTKTNITVNRHGYKSFYNNIRKLKPYQLGSPDPSSEHVRTSVVITSLTTQRLNLYEVKTQDLPTVDLLR